MNQFQAKAAQYEKGKELSNLIEALKGQGDFATEHGVDVEFSFTDVLINLMSSRRVVFAEGLAEFPGLLVLVAETMHSEFDRISSDATELTNDAIGLVRLSVASKDSSVLVSSEFLIAVSVLLSIISDETYVGLDPSSRQAVDCLVDSLLGKDENVSEPSAKSEGLASAEQSNSKHTIVEPVSHISRHKG